MLQPERKQVRLRKAQALLFSAIAVAFILFQVYTAGAGPFMSIIQRSIHLGFALVLCFLVTPLRIKGREWSGISPPNLILAVLSIVVCTYLALSANRILMEAAYVNPTRRDIILGVIAIFIVLEASRRILGWVFPVLAILAVVYAYFGPYFPGTFGHRGTSFSDLIGIIYLGPMGFTGALVGFSATLVATFVILGELLIRIGGTDTFLDFAKLVGGRINGGVAQMAVIASAAFGSINGSSGANVVTTGAVTIPAMKEAGYKPEFAGAVEATASCGGQILPPIMGAGAFIMAELTQTSYLEICKAALIPAVLFFVAVSVSIYFYSCRARFGKIPQDQMPSLKAMLPRSQMLVLPIAVLLCLLLVGFTPVTSGFFSLMTAILIFLLTRLVISFRGSPKSFSCEIKDVGIRLRMGAEASAQTLMMMAPLCACASVVIATIGVTGMGIKLTGIALGISGGTPLAALLLTMATCIILGMGIPTTAAYLLAAAVAAPILVAMGIPILASHLFIFYYAILSGVTPPVCATVYAGAVLAQTSWLRVVPYAMLLSLVAFVLPFTFIYNPALLLSSEPWAIISSIFFVLVGIICLSGATMGWLFKSANIPERILLFVGAALALIQFNHIANIAAVAILALVCILQWRFHKIDSPSPAG